jgi:beta-glucosidase
LSYTTFNSTLESADKSVAKVKVTNTGTREGAHVVQIYAHLETAEPFERRLAGFTKVTLKAGESTEVEVVLEPLAFKHFKDGWQDLVGNWHITLAENAFEQGSTVIV